MEWPSKLKMGFVVLLGVGLLLITGCTDDMTGPTQETASSQPLQDVYVQGAADTSEIASDTLHSVVDKVGTVTLSATFQTKVSKP